MPHQQSELTCIRVTEKLGLQDCRKLFGLIRRAKTAAARQTVSEYLRKTGLGSLSDWKRLTAETGKDKQP